MPDVQPITSTKADSSATLPHRSAIPPPFPFLRPMPDVEPITPAKAYSEGPWPPPTIAPQLGQAGQQTSSKFFAPFPPPPLDSIATSELEGRPIPTRQWLVPGRIPQGKVTLLAGDGGTGKTLLALQLAVAVASPKPVNDWLGVNVTENGPVIFFSAEEDKDEVHMRLARILDAQQLTFKDMGDLQLICRPTESSVLGAKGHDGSIVATPLLQALGYKAKDVDPALIIIEAAADVFSGSELARQEVGQFMGLLRSLAATTNTAVILIQHPSLTGMNDGSGRSGSTQWRNASRSAMYLTSAEPKSGEPPDPDLRVLQITKANYGPKDEKIPVRWQDGVFVVDVGIGHMVRQACERNIDAAFLRCLEIKTKQDEVVRPTTSREGFSKFTKMKEGEGYTVQQFERAKNRLQTEGKIRIVADGPPSRGKQKLVLC